jgi:FKBP-type peptidyl-prolyl cis-trans isomerase SlyD
MNHKSPPKVQDDLVVSLDYSLYVDDELLESTQESKPIQFIQGIGQIISGLEDALYGMVTGESKRVKLTPDQAYGESDPEAVQKVKQEEFSEEIPLEIGNFLDLRDKEDNVLSAQITAKDDETVTLDFNHPLAGKDLTFEITVVNLRPATPEELDHGHVH